jgi:hypothetical protein
LTLEVSGVPGRDYELGVWNPGQITSVEGAVVTKGSIRIEIPAKEGTDYSHHKVVIQFGKG